MSVKWIDPGGGRATTFVRFVGAATIVVSGQFPLGSLTADTVGVVSGVRIADPVPADNTVTFHVSGP